MPTALTARTQLQREHQLTSEMSEGLEAALSDAKEIDRQIARTLTYNSRWGKIPVINAIVARMKGVRPLASLESDLRKSLNNSLYSLSQIGNVATQEKERIAALREIYATAEAEQWAPDQFIDFIEQNTDLDFVVQNDGNTYDIKDLIRQTHDQSTAPRRAEREQEYLGWFKNHIDLSEQYLTGMHLLAAVGSEWVGGMSRSYFDITELRHGMEIIDKALRNFKQGGIISTSTQTALGEYGAAYANGMRQLVAGYRRLNELRGKGSEQFGQALSQLENELNSTALPALPAPSVYTLPARR